MDFKEFFKKMGEIQNSLLRYIDMENDDDENFQSFIKTLDGLNYQSNKSQLEVILNLISIIGSNHHHFPNFYNKLIHVLDYFKIYIIKLFESNELLYLFDNKRLILYFIEEKIITVDEKIRKIIFSNDDDEPPKYSSYFAPEVKSFVNELPHIFEQKRKIGENDSKICEIIRNDSIEEFEKYVKTAKIDIKTAMIEPSIYETNPYLLMYNPSLIEYALFFGSIKIFNYLQKNQANLRSKSWIYAIYSSKLEIVQEFTKLNITPDSTIGLFQTAIETHNNCIANNLIQTFFANNFNFDDFFILFLKSYNFSMIKIDSCIIYDETIKELHQEGYSALANVLESFGKYGPPPCYDKILKIKNFLNEIF